jgi:hypothetical protein
MNGKKPVLYDLVSDPLENEDVAERGVKHVERLAKLLPTRSDWQMEKTSKQETE